MAIKWPTPEYSRNLVNLAGTTIINEDVDEAALEEAYKIINNWRASHSYPLLNFNVNSRQKTKNIQANALVSQRIKRLESIKAKMVRDQTSTLKLSQMQDIAGCRVVLKTLQGVDKLVSSFKKSKSQHQLKSHKDYIASPKKDGYRGHHLVFCYKARINQNTAYDGLRIELQIRTELQHSWATAVEAVGIFTRQALKSNQGSQEWLRFFALMGSVCASMEGQPIVPGTHTGASELRAEIVELENQLNAVYSLEAFAATLEYAQNANVKGVAYYLVTLNREEKRVTVRPFKKNEIELANSEYTLRERENLQNANETVLVSVNSIKALRRAYPNYFLDTTQFVRTLKNYLEQGARRRRRPASQ